MAVFSYFIASAHSSYYIHYGATKDDDQRIVTAFRGLIYADPNTGEIGRITFVAVDIPRSFPVTETSERLDYDLVEISGHMTNEDPRLARLMDGRQTVLRAVVLGGYPVPLSPEELNE